jgi:hypothetical protein
MAAFCEAMKQADPAIKLFSSFPTPAVLRSAGPMLDYVCPHHYSQDLAALEDDLQAVVRMVRECAPGRRLKIAKDAVSLGGVETLACHPATTTHSEFSDEAKRESGISDALVRISVGVEDWRDLLHEFRSALDSF